MILETAHHERVRLRLEKDHQSEFATYHYATGTESHISFYRACLSCRTRKVRCDVAFKTMGCTNCTLDGKKCIVASRKTKRR